MTNEKITRSATNGGLLLLNVHPYLFHHNLGVDAALEYHFSRVNQQGKK
jgi:hypothetical protein